MLCMHEEDLRGTHARHTQAAHEQRTREMAVSFLLALAWGSGPQATLGQPGMGVQIVSVFRAGLLLHQRHILLERHALAVQAFDRDRPDEPPRLPDLELLLGGVDRSLVTRWPANLRLT